MKLLFPTKEEVDKIHQLQEEIASLTGEKAEDFESAVGAAFKEIFGTDKEIFGTDKEIFGTDIDEADEHFVSDWAGIVLCKTMLNS